MTMRLPFRWIASALCLMLLALTGCDGGLGYPPKPCTEPSDFSNEYIQQDLFVDGKGPAEYVVGQVGATLYDYSQTMYTAISRDSELPNIVSKILFLYMTLYGLMIAIGLAQITLANAIIRGFQFAVIALMFSSTGTSAFYSIAGKFFIQGVDQIIALVVNQIGTIGEALQEAATTGREPALICDTLNLNATTTEHIDTALRFGSAFQPIDIALGKLLSFPAIRFYLASMVAIPNGLFFLIVLMVGMILLILSVCNALWIYLLSMVARSLLLALGPVFILFMLFRQTWMYFDAWIKQLINFSLQPILLFAFLGLFTVLVNTSINQMFFGKGNENRIYVCYTYVALLGEGVNTDGEYFQRELPVLGNIDRRLWFWQFACPNNCTCATNNPSCEPRPLLTGIFGMGQYNARCPEMAGKSFPIDIADALVFCALCWLAFRFQPQLTRTANEMSMVFISLADTWKSLPSVYNIPTLLTGGAEYNFDRGHFKSVPIIGKPIDRGLSAVSKSWKNSSVGKAAGQVNQTVSRLPVVGWLYNKAKDLPFMGLGNILPGAGMIGMRGSQRLAKRDKSRTDESRKRFEEIQAQRRARGEGLEPFSQAEIDAELVRIAEEKKRAAELKAEEDEKKSP